jgi:hypothetical protein
MEHLLQLIGRFSRKRQEAEGQKVNRIAIQGYEGSFHQEGSTTFFLEKE